MKNSTIKKINDFGHAGDIICKIGKVLIAIAIIACLVGGIFMCFVPKETLEIEFITSASAVIHLDERIDLGDMSELDGVDGIFKVGPNTFQIMTTDSDGDAATTTVLYLSDIKWIFFSAVLNCIAAYIAFFFAGKLCAYFKHCETPFTNEIANALTKLAWALIPITIISSLMQSLSEALTGVLMGGSFDFIFKFDLLTVLLVLCVFMLSFIFKYGAALQTESDETL